jgi:hypothetical protein
MAVKNPYQLGSKPRVREEDHKVKRLFLEMEDESTYFLQKLIPLRTYLVCQTSYLPQASNIAIMTESLKNMEVLLGRWSYQDGANKALESMDG